MFDATKREVATPAPNSSYKKLFRKLKQEYKLVQNKEALSVEKLQEAKLVVFGGPREMFSADDFDALKEYLNTGGNVLFLLGEGGESRSNTNVNYLLEEFGIMVNSDSVVRAVYRKYFHPKEALISQGLLCQDIARVARGERRKSLVDTLGIRVARDREAVAGLAQKQQQQGFDFVFSYGATLNVATPAVPILSTGPLSYPVNRPIGAVSHKGKKGRLMVIGSARMFDDEFLDKEKNGKLLEVCVKWLLGENDCDMSTPSAASDGMEIAEYYHVPQTGALAEQLKPCLQESEALPRDFTRLLEDPLFKFDTSLIPESIRLYQELGIKHEPLSLIPPGFETPLPPLQPAVFPPVLREMAPPALDLFDLDECFASEKIQLAQLTNKCGDNDLDFFIRQAGDILGITQRLGDNRTAKHILSYVFNGIVKFKKLNQDGVLEGATIRPSDLDEQSPQKTHEAVLREGLASTGGVSPIHRGGKNLGDDDGDAAETLRSGLAPSN